MKRKTKEVVFSELY